MTASAVVTHREATETVVTDLSTLIRDLYPICRSITGEGVRSTLRRLQQDVPLSVHEVPSGTHVFDWTIPREWNIRDAWIQNLRGERVVDFRACNLHVVSYSVPVRRRVSLPELKEHLHTLPQHPGWIPYKTSYYRESWGFCVSAEQLEALADPEYDVCIDSTLQDGHLTYGEFYLPGQSAEEAIISCHICHPSLCNDNLSGLAVAVQLARWLLSVPDRRMSYRFLFIPGTIGSITWLARNQDRLPLIRHGVVLTGLGGPGRLVYQRSRRGTAEIDHAASHVLTHAAERGEIRDFSPYGYDERQFCSPGINLPFGRLSRTPFGEYPEYHTSADDLDFVTPAQLAGSLEACRAIIGVLEGNAVYVNLQPMCEPQLGRRGLYGNVGGAGESREREIAMLWVLNLSDGTHSLLDIAVRAQLPFEVISGAAERLRAAGLLEERVRKNTE
jgi:aminopeptidase-like protein